MVLNRRALLERIRRGTTTYIDAIDVDTLLSRSAIADDDEADEHLLNCDESRWDSAHELDPAEDLALSCEEEEPTPCGVG